MKSQKTRKRIISIFLSVLTVFCSLTPCFSAFAGDGGVIGFYTVEIFYEDGTLVPEFAEDGESPYIEYMVEGDKKQFKYSFIDCSLPDNGYVKWTSDTPTVCDVTEDGLVRAFDSSKGAAVRLWLDNEVGTIPLVGGLMKKALEKVLFNDKVNLDTMDADQIVSLVEDAFGSDSILAQYIDSYKGELIDSLRQYLDKVHTIIYCTMYDADGTVLDQDSFSVVVNKSEEIYADFIPNGTHITNKQDVPTTVAKGSKVQLSACTTPTRLHMGVIYSVKSSSIFDNGKVVATVDDSGLVSFKNTGTVTILVSPDTEGFINNLLKYINYIYELENTGVIDSGQIADILIKYVGLDMNRNVLAAILDTCFAIADIAGDTADPVQLTATAVKIIANIILQFTTNDSITFTVVEGVPMTDFKIAGATAVKEGTQIQLEITDTKPVAAITDDITWTSSDPSIASVDPVTGTITGRDAGGSLGEYSQQTVTITATSAANNISKTYDVTVTGKTGRYLSDVEITTDYASINIGGDEYCHATVYPNRVATADNLYLHWGIAVWNEETQETEYLWAGDAYQETDEEGNLLTDENGEPVMNDGSVTDGIGKIDSTGHYWAVAGGTCTVVCRAETGYYIYDGSFYQISEVMTSKDVDNGQPVESISLAATGTTNGSTLTTTQTEVNGETLKYAMVRIKAGDGDITYNNKGAVITATILPEDATNKNLNWYVDNDNFTVTKDNSNGTAKIKLSAGNEVAQSVNIYCVSEDGDVKSDVITLCVARNYANSNSIVGDNLSVINGQTLSVEHEMNFDGSLSGNNAVCRNANWYSSDEDVLQVVSIDTSTGNAVVKGVDVGTVTLTCVSTDGGIKDEVTVTVYPDKSRLNEIISLCEKTIIRKTADNAKDYQEYMRKLNYAYYIRDEVALASQDSVETYAEELLYIFYKLGGFIGLNSVTILDQNSNKAGEYISVDVETVSYKNTKYDLGYLLNPVGAMYSSIKWESDSDSVSVDKNGVCKPTSNSSCYATITVTATDYMGTAVSDSVVISFGKTVATGVTIEPASVVGARAQTTLQLEAKISPLNVFGNSTADVQAVTWYSSDESVATVDENGLVYFVFGGDCEIYCVTKDGGFVGTCTVNVVTNYDALQELVNTYTSLSLSEENYYPDTYAAYTAKLNEAKALIAAQNSTQKEVNQMYSELEAAYKGLKKYTYIQRVELYLDGEATSDFYQYDLSLLKEGLSYKNAELDLKVRLYPNNASYSSVKWESSTDLISISQDGIAKPTQNKSCYGRITCTVTDHFNHTFSDDVWVSFSYKPVTQVEVSPTAIAGNAGDTTQLVKTIYPTGDSLVHIGAAEITDVYWESDNESVATVDQNGLVTFVGAGATIIRCVSYDGGFAGECRVSTNGDRSVLKTVIAQYENVNYMDYTYNYGMAFKAAYEEAQVALYDDTYTQEQIDAAADKLAAAGAALAGNEFVIAQTINLSYENQTQNAVFEYKSKGTGTLSADASAHSYQGTSTTYNSRTILTASLPADAASNYTSIVWTVNEKSDNTEASIDGSKITINAAKASQSAKTLLTVTATDTYGRTVSRTIRVVVARYIVTGVSLDKTSVTQYANAGSFRLSATVTPSDAKVQEVLWYSSDERVATVDSSGLVTPKNSGSCVITAESYDGAKKATCSVTLTTDYTRLASRYAELKDFYDANKDTQKYTQASMDILNQALVQANTIINESTAKQADVDLMVSKLNEAYDGLVLFVPVSSVSISPVAADNLSTVNDGFIRYSATSLNNVTIQLSAQVLPSNSTPISFTWSSTKQNEGISVDENGFVTKTGASADYAIITATATDELGNTATGSVCVSFVRTPVKSVSFENEIVYGAPTTTKTIKAKVAGSTSLAQPSLSDCLYSSANPEIATVDEITGVVTFVATGETVITAKSADGGHSATIRVITTNDTTALAAAIEEYSTVVYTDYAYDYGTAFKTAYENAVAVCDDYTASQAVIDNALTQLQTAYNNLSGHPFITPGEVQIQLSDSTVVQDGGIYVKNANNQLVLQGVYATGAMIKSAVFTYENATNLTAQVVDGKLLLTKNNTEATASIDVTYTVTDDYDRETVVTASIKVIDDKTPITSFKFVYNGEEVEAVNYTASTLYGKSVQLGINTYPENAENYTSIVWGSSNSKITVDSTGLVKLSGAATSSNYTATITCTITLADGSTIRNSIPVTFTRG